MDRKLVRWPGFGTSPNIPSEIGPATLEKINRDEQGQGQGVANEHYNFDMIVDRAHDLQTTPP